MSYLVQANILVILFRQIFLFKGAFRRKPKLYVAVTTLKYACFAFALYIGRAYSGTLFYMVCAANIIIQQFRMEKSWFTKTVLTLFIVWCNLMTLKFNIYHLLPYFILISYMWIKPYTKGFIRKRIFDIEDIMLIVYAYHYKIYALFFFELVDLIFRHASSSMQKLIKYTDDKTSVY